MGKKRKKSSSSSSSSSDKKKKKTKKSSKKEDKKEDKKEEKKEEKKAPVVAPPRGGARFNALDSDDEDGGVSKAGLSSASAADLFNKKQWEMMARMKVDYKKQTDEKASKEAQIREKDEQRATNREMKRAKKMAEEEEAAAEAASLEKASKLHELSSEQKEKRKADAEAAAVARKFGPSGPMGGVSQRSVGDVMYSSDLHIGEGHGGFGGAGV
ncbi:unnamed protein product [Polarella glacialis]|uniref:Uncharacterized protein n=1 Tax=Polarella glacialis TaxID=89957 RepID=A0A813JG87_POLGL|nr:unnamed protein product [Polarella glacialis]